MPESDLWSQPDRRQAQLSSRSGGGVEGGVIFTIIGLVALFLATQVTPPRVQMGVAAGASLFTVVGIAGAASDWKVWRLAGGIGELSTSLPVRTHPDEDIVCSARVCPQRSLLVDRIQARLVCTRSNLPQHGYSTLYEGPSTTLSQPGLLEDGQMHECQGVLHVPAEVTVHYSDADLTLNPNIATNPVTWSVVICLSSSRAEVKYSVPIDVQSS